MKDPKITLATLLTSSALICATLMGCQSTSAVPQKSSSAQNSSIDTSYAEVYQAQIEYYEAQLKDLEDKLLDEKENSFISGAEYQLQIDELRDIIASLTESQDSSSNPDVTSDTTLLSPSQESTTEPNFDHIYNNEENRPSTETLSSKSGFKYHVQNGYITITAYLGNEKTIFIPSAIDGIKVTAIGEDAFKNCSAERIVIPDTVELIDWFAFYSCKCLHEITVPSSVTSIGHGAFDLCPDDLIIKCKKDSYTETYARSWGFIVVAE